MNCRNLLATGWAIRWRDLWWALGAPLYIIIGTIRHEGSHLLVGLAQGAHLTDISVLPSNGAWGYVHFDGGYVTWLMLAAPYAFDLVTFLLGYVWAFRIDARHRWLFMNVFIVMVLSPLVDTANNYLFMFSPLSDAGRLAIDFSAGQLHTFFIPTIVLYAFGLARVLTRTPVALQSADSPLDATCYSEDCALRER